MSGYEEGQVKYPVYITCTSQHLVWVEAENQAAAVAGLEYDTHEYVNSGNCIDGWTEVRAPGEYDEPHGRADAHVQTRREHLWRLNRDHGEAMAEEENRRGTRPSERTTCVFCRMWIDDKFHGGYSHDFAIRQDERRAEEMAAAMVVAAR